MHRLLFIQIIVLLPILCLAQPPNDDCVNAVTLTINIGSCTPGGSYLTVGATNSLSTACMSSLYKDTWYKFTPTGDLVTAEISGFWSSAKVELFDACGGNSLNCQGGGSSLTAIWSSLVAGNTYWFRIGVLPSQGEGIINLCLWQPLTSPYNDCPGAVLTVGNTCVYTNIDNTTWDESFLSGCGSLEFSVDGFIQVNVSNAGDFVIQFGNVPADQDFEVYQGASCLGTSVYCGFTTGNAQYVVNAPTIGWYLIRTGQDPGAPTGDIQICVWQNATPPCTNLTNPLNGATNVPVTTSLTWAAATGATGYKLTVGTTSGGTDILDNVDVGDVTTYDPAGNFPYSTSIYVTITPYNGSGDATGCVEEFFTTADQCPPEDVLLLTQAEVDAFALMYPACTQINGSLTIGDFGYNSDVDDLSGLSPLTAATSLNIYSNPLLSDLTGLQNFTTLSSGLFILGNNGLTNLSGLGSLSSLGSINIAFNENLVNLVGIGNITGLPLDLQINFNPALTSLVGLSNLTFTGLDLGLTYNNVLSDLTALSSLDSVGGHLNIGYCPAITSLAGLENLTIIVNELTIIHNAGLTSLLNLSSLDTIGGNLEINGNPLLSNCEAQAICDYLSAPPGTVTIQNNAAGCNSQAEVQLACTPSCTNLTNPLNSATNVPVTTSLTWDASTGATGYKLTVGTTSGGTDILDNFDVGNVTTYDPPGNLPSDTTIYVTIIPYNANGDAVGCIEESFMTSSCIPNLLVVSLPVPAGNYHSLGDLVSYSSTVEAGTVVLFTSDTGVLLDYDFTVEIGAVFEIDIQGCP